MYRSPTSIGNKLALTLCVLVAICFASFARASIQTGNPQTCPCPGIRGPVNICPNVPQNLIVTDPPVGSVITFSVATDVPGNTGHIVSQSGATATIDQPGTYIANVCFPLNLNVPLGPNCGGNPCSPVIVASLTSSVIGNPSQVTICQTGPASIVLTCSANVAVDPATTTYRFFLNNALFRENASPALTVDFTTFSGSLAAFTCQVVTQSNQCFSSTSNVINVVKCSGGGNCPETVTLSSLDNCPSFRLQATINNPRVNTIYTFTLRRISTSGIVTVLGIQVVGPFGTIPSGGVFAIYSNLPAGAASFVVDVNIPNCPVLTSNSVSIPDCGQACQPVGATLTADQPGGNVLTICSSPPGPPTIGLTCTPTSSVSGATFRFTRDGVVVAESTANVLLVFFSDFANVALSQFSCQVITQSGSCVGTASNVITIQRCAGGGNCPVTPSVTLVAVGNACPFQLQAIINNPQINTVYSITLFTQTVMDGPRVALATQTVGPFTSIPAGGVSITFSNLPTTAAWYEVDVAVQGCPVVTSNIVDLPNCGCENVGATLSSDQPGNPSSLVICNTPPGPSTIVLTCTATSSVSGAVFRFIQNGATVQESASNTLTLDLSQFTSISLANIFCQVITQSGQCVGTQSNLIIVQRCSGGGGNCPTPTLTVKSGDLCSGTLTLFSSISGCTNGVSYVFTLQSSTVVGGPFTNTGQPLSVVCSNGAASATFSGISQAAFYRVQLSSSACTTSFSDVLNVPQQTTLPLGTTLILSVDHPICHTTNQVATLTCNINPPSAIIGTVVYQFFAQGSTTPIAPTSGNTLVLNSNSQGNLNYFCTASVGNSCIITSNIVLVNVCSGGGGNCPTPIIQRGGGDVCSGTLQIGALINNCVPGTTYTFTLQRAPAGTGPFTNVVSPAPIDVVCSGTSQAVATFTGIASIGFYRVSVSSTACTTTFSEVLEVPQQTLLPPGSSVTLTVDQGICVATGKSATLTCTISPSSAIVGTITYQFFVVGSTTAILPTSGNQLVLNMNNQGGQSYFCVASVDSNCVIRSNDVLVQVCSGVTDCPTTQPVLTASRLSVCFPFSCTKLVCKATVPNGSRLVIREESTGTELASGQDVISRIVCPDQTTAFVCVLETPGCPDVTSDVVVEVTRPLNSLCGGNKVNVCQKARQSFLKICMPFDSALVLGAIGDSMIMDGSCPQSFTRPTGACSLAALAEAFVKKECHPNISAKSDKNSFFNESEWQKEQP